MPVVGYKKDSAGKTLGIFYNDLWDTTGPRFLSVHKDILVRKDFKVSSPKPQPDSYSIPKKAVYAIALQDNVDTDSELERMKIIIPMVDEPDWGTEDKLNEKPVDMNISCEIVELSPGLKYTILRFESSSLVPKKKFVESMNWTKSWQFTATSDTEIIADFDIIRSD